MTKIEQTNSSYFDELIKKTTAGRTVTSNYQYIKDPSSLKNPGDIKTILCIQDSHLSEVATKSLAILEDEETFNVHWMDLKWKLLSYLTVQDAFSAAFHKGRDETTIFRQWYFYYEAKYILFEAILCGLNGFSASIGLLMRLFLEFSLLQNYSYLKIQTNRSFSTVEDYFGNNYNPNWSTILNGCLPSEKFCKPIRKRLKMHLDGLSQTSAHPYQPGHSPKHMGSFVPEQSLEGLFFPYKLSVILEPVLWMYFVNFPMLFHPVNIQKKFGFNYPVGLFIDKMDGAIIKQSISKEDFKHFYNYSVQTDQFKDLICFYNSRPDLSDEDIEKTWDSELNGEFKDFILGHGMQMSKLRVLAEAMALKPREEPPASVDVFSENFSFDKWKSFYKKLK